MAHLEIKTKQGTTQVALDGSPLAIGRHPKCTLVLDDDEASRRHCVIESIGSGFQVRDLGSRNGTRLNKHRVSQEPLKDGDLLQVGGTTLRFVQGGDPAGPDPTADRAVPPPPPSLSVGYEKRLNEIIDSVPTLPYEAEDLALVDCQGQTVHAAETRGGDDEEIDGGAIHAFRLLLMVCFATRASDLHIEPRPEHATARVRVDGFMVRLTDFRPEIFGRLLGVVKILCQLDIGRRNIVQEGHFSVKVGDRRVDYRVSLTPSVHGQKLVVRVLDSSNAPSRLGQLGLVPWMQGKLVNLANREAGMVLACGPTGSGKTTSLYSCLRELDLEQRNAVTIEDPVEYYLEGCTQIPIDHKQETSFASILRSVLRQDPDVIFVGEIRDTETATVAMQAAMTGHLVYSTVHSKDSIGAIFRLLDLGAESYLVANSVDLILAQRLVRVLCPNCRKAVRPTPAQNMKMGRQLEGVPRIYLPGACLKCLKTGFKGRRAIFELLEFSEAMRDVVLRAPTIKELTTHAERGLFTSLRQYGFQLVSEGVTSIEEVERVIGLD